MIADMNGDRLTRAAKQAGIGTEDNRFSDHDAEDKQRRGTILNAEFVASLGVITATVNEKLAEEVAEALAEANKKWRGGRDRRH